MNPIPVLHITDTLDAGGYERLAVNLVNALPRERFSPALCTTRREGVLEAEVAPEVSRLRLGRRGLFDARAVARLAGYLRERGVRIVHAHGPSLFIARAAAMLAPRAVVIWHAHSGRMAEEDRACWAYRTAAAGAAGVISVNQVILEWVRRRLRLPDSRTWHLPNFVMELPPAAGVPDLPGDPARRVVCVANLRPEKDHRTLLRAFALASREVPDARLLLVGAAADAAYERQLRADAAALGLGDSVSFLGPRADVPAVLRASAAGVLSSAFEGLPMSLLEYGMAGLATVATDAGETGEVLGHGQAGILVPRRDAAALAEGLVALLRSSELRARLGEELRRRVRARYGAGAVVPRLCGIYDAVLSAA